MEKNRKLVYRKAKFIVYVVPYRDKNKVELFVKNTKHECFFLQNVLRCFKQLQ